MSRIARLSRPVRLSIVLAAVADRGGRELPFRADVVGIEVEAEPGQRVLLRITGDDRVEGIVRVDSLDRS